MLYVLFFTHISFINMYISCLFLFFCVESASFFGLPIVSLLARMEYFSYQKRRCSFGVSTVQLNGLLQTSYFSSVCTLKRFGPCLLWELCFWKKKRKSLINVISNVGHFRRADATPLEVVLWQGCDHCPLQAVTIAMNTLWHDILSGLGCFWLDGKESPENLAWQPVLSIIW